MDKHEVAAGTSQAAAIHDLRFGNRNIQELDDRDIVALLDYNLPADVIQLCFDEIARRRSKNLLAR